MNPYWIVVGILIAVSIIGTVIRMHQESAMHRRLRKDIAKIGQD